MNHIANRLLYSPLFSGMTESEITSLLVTIHYQVKDYYKNEVIAFSGSECKSLQIVIEGTVRCEMTDMAGRVLKIEDVGVARPLAIAFLFGNNNRYPVTITANLDVTILAFSRDSVIKLIQASEVFLTNFMNAVSGRAQFIAERLKFHSFQSLRGKLADYLLGLDVSNKGVVLMDKTQEELAELFGVTRPSLSRVLREFHNQGLIRADRKRVEITNRQGLMGCIGG